MSNALQYPLHQEVFSAVKELTAKKNKKIPLMTIVEQVRRTKHASRVRIALEALEKDGLIDSLDGEYFPVKSA